MKNFCSLLIIFETFDLEIEKQLAAAYLSFWGNKQINGREIGLSEYEPGSGP